MPRRSPGTVGIGSAAQRALSGADAMDATTMRQRCDNDATTMRQQMRQRMQGPIENGRWNVT
jgi:hypothetical protein